MLGIAWCALLYAHVPQCSASPRDQWALASKLLRALVQAPRAHRLLLAADGAGGLEGQLHDDGLAVGQPALDAARPARRQGLEP